jgi:hypothetical protein
VKQDYWMQKQTCWSHCTGGSSNLKPAQFSLDVTGSRADFFFMREFHNGIQMPACLAKSSTSISINFDSLQFALNQKGAINKPGWFSERGKKAFHFGQGLLPPAEPSLNGQKIRVLPFVFLLPNLCSSPLWLLTDFLVINVNNSGRCSHYRQILC